ncbi:MAG: UbiA family prenyltransferase [Candidatus Lightella neohaematopini]|nr:UbiA family prenyltransferase [Candidatus Lightella neohaematopini]
MNFINTFKNKILLYGFLIRIHQPTGLLLLLWPTLWSLWLTKNSSFSNFSNTIVFILEVVITRSAGCVINDCIDYKFDYLVTRTKNRPLPTNKLKINEAYLIFILLLVMATFLVLVLDRNIIILSILALVLMIIYPFLKRYIYTPQLILGIAFSLPILIVYRNMHCNYDTICWLFFFTNWVWVLLYDSIYALIDKNDDVKLGIKSIVMLFNKLEIFIILQVIITLLLLIINLYIKKYILLISILLINIIFFYQYKLICTKKRNNYYKAFTVNNYIGLLVLVGLIV